MIALVAGGPGRDNRIEIVNHFPRGWGKARDPRPRLTEEPRLSMMPAFIFATPRPARLGAALLRALAPALIAAGCASALAPAAFAEEASLAPKGGGLSLAPAPATEPLAPDPLTAVPPPTVFERAASILPAFVYGNGVFDAAKPDLVMTVRGGVRFYPAYFGSTKVKTGPDAAFRIDHAELPGGITLGSNATGFLKGFGLRLTGRYIAPRNSSDYPEIRGLDDVPFTLETGLGIGYEQRYARAFADLRYGIVGTNAWTGDVGADGIAHPTEGLTLTLGPRVSFGSARFMDTYFGVSPEESQASGMAAFAPEGGIYGAGMELGARYLFNDRWGVEGAARWTRLMNGAQDSPIVESGSDDQYQVRIDLTRRISLDF